MLITLYGGNDGLDTVVPAADPAYQQARGELAVAEKDALPLADGLSFHPSLPRLARRYGEGGVAIVRGVGYPEPDHSHFRSMSIWQTASPQTAVPTGWLGRWLDATSAQAAAAGGPIQAVGIGATLTPALVGARRSAAAVPVGPLAVPGGTLGAGHPGALSSAARQLGGLRCCRPSPGSTPTTSSVADRLGTLLPAATPPDTGKGRRSGGASSTWSAG